MKERRASGRLGDSNPKPMRSSSRDQSRLGLLPGLPPPFSGSAQLLRMLCAWSSLDCARSITVLSATGRWAGRAGGRAVQLIWRSDRTSTHGTNDRRAVVLPVAS
jgi:hypothetical protein|eukprot:SAG25_NODE_81_length_16694_cov_8.663332_5_plen_105_part_00